MEMEVMEEATLRCRREMRVSFSLPQRRVADLYIGAFLLCLILLSCIPAWTQHVSPSPAPAAAQPEFPQDALGRTTPRGTVLGFLIAARKNDDDLAARYLDTGLQGKAAADLAHQLFVVLDRRLPARFRVPSDQPEGSLSDPLRPDHELVGTVRSESGNVEIILERVDRGKSGSLWLFSRNTLESIPDLYDEIEVISVESVLPAFLVENRFAGIVLFQWLAVFVGVPLFFLVTALLNRILRPLAVYGRRRLYRKLDLSNPQVLPMPVRLLLLALLIRWSLAKLGLPLMARQFWLSTASIITIVGCVWVLILLNGVVEAHLGKGARGRKLPSATLMLRFARRIVDLLFVFAGLLVALYHFGVNLTAALAGLGVGGIAVALAAQKTLENIIGGISLIFDRAVSVGDTLKVGDTLGVVDDIGLRSTRIRTLDRTMVSVPNGQIATMTLENFSSRDKFWLHPVLRLHQATTSSQMDAVLNSIRRLLIENQQIEPESVRVRFLGFGPSSLEIEVFAYVLAGDWSQFLEIQEQMLLRVMECVESAGAQIALPSHSIFLAAASKPTRHGVEELVKALELNATTNDQVAAKSA